jgi:uncharacterized iron-regulated protein
MVMAAAAWVEAATGVRLPDATALERLASAPVVLLGESHDCAADHLWQAATIAALAERRPVTVGYEMFPRHARPALEGWVSGALDEAAFLEATRWHEVWGFDPALYMPVLRLCRDRGLPMRGLNLDRPLVTLVGRDGWEALPAAERAWLTPATPASPGYRRYLFEATGGARPGRAATAPEDPAFDRFVRAQQAWDRAFACAIAEARAESPDRLVAALIGRGHLEFGGGTPAQLSDLGVFGVAVALPGGEIGLPAMADLIYLPPEGESEGDGAT